MFVMELAFDDDPRRLAARPGHRRRLTDLHAAGVVVAAGPWDDDRGALLVFDTDQEGLDAIMAADPYYSVPGVTVTSVRRWQPVVGPGREPA